MSTKIELTMNTLHKAMIKTLTLGREESKNLYAGWISDPHHGGTTSGSNNNIVLIIVSIMPAPDVISFSTEMYKFHIISLL